MSDNGNPQDPLAFMKTMWSNMGITVPGMIIPTMDPDELEKRIKDLRAVEGWLRMNLNMLSASINTLEIQRATLVTVKSFAQAAKAGSSKGGTARKAAGDEAGKSAGPAAGETAEPNANPFVNPSIWPWNLMQQAAAEPAVPESPRRKPEGGER